MSELSSAPSPAGRGSPSDLHTENTFGIELEFFLIYHHDCEISPHAVIADVLQRHGIPCRDEDSLHQRQLALMNGIREQDNEQRYSTWRVTDDFHALTEEQRSYFVADLERNDGQPRNEIEYYICSLELISRKFYYHRDNWQDEIRAVLAAIHTLEQSERFKLIVNQDCGFHVHVGNAATRVPLDTAREVAKLVTAFEPQIEVMHAVHRVASWDQECLNKSPSYMHLINLTPSTRVHETTMRAFLQRIEHCDSYAQLAEVFSYPGPRPGWMSDGKSSAYNFDQLFHDPAEHRTRIIRTVEFRQHTGTLSVPAILNWVHVVQAIFMAAQYKCFDELRAERRAAGDQWSTIEMLRQIGVTPGAVMYYAARQDRLSGFLEEYYERQEEKFRDERFFDFFETIVGPGLVGMEPDDIVDAIEYKRRKWASVLLEKTGGRATEDEIKTAMRP